MAKIKSIVTGLVFLSLNTFYYKSNAEGLKSIYQSAPVVSCSISTARWIGIEKPGKRTGIKEYKFCQEGNTIYKLSVYKTKPDKPARTSFKKLGTLGKMMTIQGQFSSSGRQISPDRRRQYELEQNKLIKYECIKSDCKRNVVQRTIIALPLNSN